MAARQTPIQAPVWPPKPDLSNEVEWGPLPTNDEYKRAQLCWKLPNDTLRRGMALSPLRGVIDEEGKRREEKEKTMGLLACNVYDHLESREDGFQAPHKEPAPSIQQPDEGDGWSFPEVGDKNPAVNNAVLEGHSIMDKTDKYWTKARIERYLKDQGQEGLVPKKPYQSADMCRQILQNFVNGRSDSNIPGLSRRSDLSTCGFQRQSEYIIPPSDGHHQYNAFHLYTWAVHLSPYNPTYWLSRAYLFYQQCHFDLALGDAYRAWYLIEILVNSTERNKQPGLYPRIWDAIARHVECNEKLDSEAGKLMRRENGVNYFVPHIRRTIHHIISLSLIALDAWEDYEEMDKYLPARLQQVGKYKKAFDSRLDHWRMYVDWRRQRRQIQIGAEEAEESNEGINDDGQLWIHQERKGVEYPKHYPQEDLAVDRRNEVFLRILNEQLADVEDSHFLVVPEESDTGLRVVAGRDMEKGHLILVDQPSVRSHLRRTIEVADGSCEHCKTPIEDTLGRSGRYNPQERSRHPTGATRVLEDPDVYFCSKASNAVGSEKQPDKPTSSRKGPGKRTASQAGSTGIDRPTKLAKGNAGQRTAAKLAPSGPESARIGHGGVEAPTCLEQAREQYHRHVGGKHWRWLHDAMGRIPEERNRSPFVNHERHGTFLSLLLREVFDITLIRREQEPLRHYLAHEIPPLLPLQSRSPKSPFPFGWSANIVVPFGILQALGVNIFRDLDFDTWVIQEVLRKLQLNLVPWDEHRRGSTDPINRPSNQKSRKGKGRESAQGPSEGANLENLYVYTAFALINHAGPEKANARWRWDKKQNAVRNRIVVESTKFIKKGSEIFAKYFPDDAEDMTDLELHHLELKQKRILGQLSKH